MRLAAATAATTSGGAPAGAIAVRPSAIIAAAASGAATGGAATGAGTDEKPPVTAVWARASAAQSSMAQEADRASMRPRLGRVDFTVLGLQLRFAVRFR